jgi:tRNA nucleotidyltransferase (CCA-adding enzyme)
MTKIKTMPIFFQQALPILKKIEKAGFKAYFVGGSVRDLLLGRKIHDVDIASSAYPEEIKKLFDKTIDTGIKHGTVTVLYQDHSYEITTFRTESGYQDFRRPDHVDFVENLSDDLKRRDFTINAMAIDHQGQIIDLFNGLQDLKKHLIKAVGDPETRFHEDALRMMRAVRFMSQLNFSVESKTKQAIADHHQLLSKISVERIRDEFVKLGLGPNARPAFQLFLDTKLSENVPGFAGQADKLAVFPKLKFNPQTEANFWAVIIILLGLEIKQIRSFMRQWKNSNALTNQVEAIVSFFDLLSRKTPDDYDLFQVGRNTLFSVIDLAHTLGQPIQATALVDRYEALPIKADSEFVIDGNYLISQGFQPGRRLGQILAQIKRLVVMGQLENNREAIAAYLANKKESSL